MAKKTVIYKHLSFFDREFEFLKQEGNDFEIQHTTYTKKILLKNDINIIYNDTGKEDKRLLYLINQVRRDAKEYQQFNQPTEKETRFFDMFRAPDDRILVKIDIKGAYWEYALKRGVITNKTNQLFKKLYRNESYDVSKGARLKALGSLSTSKKIDFYENGKINTELTKINKQETSNIYDEICNGIDEIMREVNTEFDGCVYYYWDCVFVFKEYEEDIINFFKKKEFKVKTGTSKLAYFKTGNSGYLKCELENKQYLTRPEHRALLENIQDEYELSEAEENRLIYGKGKG